MKYFTGKHTYIVVLQKDEDLYAGLRQFLEQSGVQTAWLQGLGAALELEIGYYDLQQKQYKWRTFDGAYEITGLQGNIVRGEQGEPLFHVHGTFADTTCQAIGGHVNKLVVAGTCELLVTPLDAELTRSTDQTTGLKLLCAGPAV